MNLILKRDPVWLQCLPTIETSATLLLLGGDYQKVAVPAHLLLAASPLVRRILTDHLSPTYSPCCISLPAATSDVLQVFGEILTTGRAAGAHEEEIEEVQQVFEMLGVEALIVRCHLESVQSGKVLELDIKQEHSNENSDTSLDVENISQFEVFVKQEVVESQLCPQIIVKKSRLNLEQSSITSVYNVNKIPCNLCTGMYHKNVLKRHIESVHKKVQIPCCLCPKKFTRKSSLKIHIQSVHKKVEFPCNHCSHKFNHKSNLRRHKDSVHKKIKYPCNHCIDKFTKKSSLKKHIETFHKEIEYA